jgi:large subunit ribosomal protein L11
LGLSEKSVTVIVNGGQASPGPPLGPTLGPLGVNVGAVVSEINRLTQEFTGMKVPITVLVNPTTKQFTIAVGVPSTAALIVREAKGEKGSGAPSSTKIGDLTFEQLLKIALAKRAGSYASSLRAAAKEVLGTCLSLGVTVEGEDPREIGKKIDQGAFDDAIKAKDNP